MVAAPGWTRRAPRSTWIPAPAGREEGHRAHLQPEFRNRLDGWIAFSSLPMDVVERIVDKQIDELRCSCGEDVELQLLPERADGCRPGFSPQFGARPMARLIQTALKKPLAEDPVRRSGKGGKVILVCRRTS